MYMYIHITAHTITFMTNYMPLCVCIRCIHSTNSLSNTNSVSPIPTQNFKNSILPSYSCKYFQWKTWIVLSSISFTYLLNQCNYLLNITTTAISSFFHLCVTPASLNVLECRGCKGYLCVCIRSYTSLS